MAPATSILEHKLYIPTLPQLNDPVDGRPRTRNIARGINLQPFCSVRSSRTIQACRTEHMKEKSRSSSTVCSTPRRGNLDEREMSSILNRELWTAIAYRIPCPKRYDNLSLWDRYAAHHSGYCLEFSNEGALFEHAKDRHLW